MEKQRFREIQPIEHLKLQQTHLPIRNAGYFPILFRRDAPQRVQVKNVHLKGKHGLYTS